MAPRNCVLLDKDRRAVNIVVLDLALEFTLPEGVVGFALYDGPFYPGGKWDGKQIIDPNPTAEEPSAA